MVRAGVVAHPVQWLFSGYNDIQEPRKKNVLIDYERLKELFGIGSNDRLREVHQQWINEYLARAEKNREEEWTRSIAVGSQPFVENVKDLLGVRAKGREVTEGSRGISFGRKSPAIRPFLRLKTSI
jgi:putative transposase